MWIVGLTGGIGSGKSAAAEQFASQGVTIIDSDIIAREVVAPGQPALVSIREHFGHQVLSSDGTLDRAWLRAHIFTDPSAKNWLESLLHPLIREATLNQLQATLAPHEAPYRVLCSPLLFETKQDSLVNTTLVIDLSEERQLARCLMRDNVERAQIKAIMQTQYSRQQRCAKADTIIDNNGTLQQLQQAVNHYHQQTLDALAHNDHDI